MERINNILGGKKKKKIILSVMLIMTIIGCSARDIELWNETDRIMEERGHTCYKERGYYYCKDTK